MLPLLSLRQPHETKSWKNTDAHSQSQMYEEMCLKSQILKALYLNEQLNISGKKVITGG